MEFLIKSFFAVIAAIGFSMVFRVDKKDLPIVGLLAFCGFAVRSVCQKYGLGLELSVLFGALCIGIIGEMLSKKREFPVQMLTVPAGIVMIPGLYVFESIKNLILFVSADSMSIEKAGMFFYYFGKSMFVLVALAIGLTFFSVIFRR
jgi:uncharacterized membrane protein YjjB (DUF3815 family)